MFEDGGSAHLEICESAISDSGVYKCTVTNTAGAAESTCTVTVPGK